MMISNWNKNFDFWFIYKYSSSSRVNTVNFYQLGCRGLLEKQLYQAVSPALLPLWTTLLPKPTLIWPCWKTRVVHPSPHSTCSTRPFLVLLHPGRVQPARAGFRLSLRTATVSGRDGCSGCLIAHSEMDSESHSPIVLVSEHRGPIQRKIPTLTL